MGCASGDLSESVAPVGTLATYMQAPWALALAACHRHRAFRFAIAIASLRNLSSNLYIELISSIMSQTEEIERRTCLK